MASGCAVVSTRRASLKEVVGEAALTVDDPNDIQGVADHIVAVLTDDHLKRDLRERGFRQAALYTPERTMQAVADVYFGLL